MMDSASAALLEYPNHASRQGRWNIYGINLPDDVLRKVYRDSALKLLTPF